MQCRLNKLLYKGTKTCMLPEKRKWWLEKLKLIGCNYSLDWTTGLTYFCFFYACCGWLNWFLLLKNMQPTTYTINMSNEISINLFKTFSILHLYTLAYPRSNATGYMITMGNYYILVDWNLPYSLLMPTNS